MPASSATPNPMADQSSADRPFAFDDTYLKQKNSKVSDRLDNIVT